MHNAQLLQILNTRYDLLEELACLCLFQTLLFDDVIEQFALGYVFCDEVELLRRLNNLIKLNDIWMSGQLEDLDLSRDALDIDVLDDFVFLENLNSYFFTSDIVHAKLHLSKGAFAYRLAYSVMPDGLRLILSLVPTLIPWLGVVLVFWFLTSLFIVGILIIVIYLFIRIDVSGGLSLCALLSFRLV